MAERIVTRLAEAQAAALKLGVPPADGVLEIGPGRGVLTELLLAQHSHIQAVEVDPEARDFLAERFASQPLMVHDADILAFDPRTALAQILPAGNAPASQLALIGNLPYNISSPILFWLLAQRETVPVAVFMVQKEVADRICAPMGSRESGILTVLLDAFYERQYAFAVEPGAFIPPPKVRSAVFTLIRRQVLPTDWPMDSTDDIPFAALTQVVKAAFNQRRKTLRNALGGIPIALPEDLASLRAEALKTQEIGRAHV